MTESVPTSLAGGTHYGNLGANFNQGDPSMMSEVVSVRALNVNAPVFIVDVASFTGPTEA
ncbi:hypothetical protein CRG98_008696 [Punica granatum]|uniref:Uncharacterized protein n=1 Tax=Punica granatum TaxID=22663 RepID=A0A2I0KR12_PUNGR|nr:hypothetical protein CRG98_008696 [Punica granatum]